MFNWLTNSKKIVLPPSREIIKSGILGKKSGILNKWKDYFFILAGTCLYYTPLNKETEFANGKIELEEAIIITFEDPKREECFSIKTVKPYQQLFCLCVPHGQGSLVEWMSILLQKTVTNIIIGNFESTTIVPKRTTAVTTYNIPLNNTQKAAIKIQSIYRAYKTRKNYIEIKNVIKKRTNIVNEMVETERTYFSSLKIILEEFEKPLQHAFAFNPKGIISNEEIFGLFSNIDMIYNIHELFGQDLENAKRNWFPQQLLAPIFLKFVESMKFYTQYVNNFNRALEIYEGCKNKVAFCKFLEEKKNISNIELDLNAFLIMPVQRLPRYEMLLRELTKNTWKEHADYDNLQRALKSVITVTKYINDKKREAENMQKLVSVQQRLQDAHPIVSQLLQPHRRYIREGTILQLKPNKIKERYGFLFNDLFLVTKKTSKRKKNTLFGETVRFKMTGCICLPIEACEIDSLDNPEGSFIIRVIDLKLFDDFNMGMMLDTVKSKSLKTKSSKLDNEHPEIFQFLFQLATITLKDEWIADMRSAITDLHTKSIRSKQLLTSSQVSKK
eukprot:TRINITY_DN7193_c0_g1_i1.p1 TRINITY_DN7193_c0_g1~~TRINITY_DN7193_c0_g1_i1.p1  ORF type:complete len:558 (-),score=190.50 TRINITY_DN7193_c0_g1_i1:75-1748(-)